MAGINRAGVAPDPIETMLADETARDHALAVTRGQRLERLAGAAITRMVASGSLPAGSAHDAFAAIVRAAADEFYGNAAIDVPTMRRSS